MLPGNMTRLCCLVLVCANATVQGFAANTVTMMPSQPSCMLPCNRHAVVFVHGIFGGADTWVNGSVSFPELLRTDHSLCDQCDVFVITYPTKPSELNKLRLTVIGKELAEQLDLLANYSSIHIIGHSMGGNAILISLMFTKFLHEDAHQRLTKYKNIILLGTPIEGASLANFRWLAERFVGGDPQLIALKPITDNELPVLTELALKTIDEKRAHLLLTDIPIATAWEEKRFGDALIIVPRESATALGTEHEGFAKDHFQLAKPANRDDCVYKWVAGLLSEGMGKPRAIYNCPANSN
jgi:pimeloyl-ACP methyl ester carboxylesterase